MNFNKISINKIILAIGAATLITSSVMLTILWFTAKNTMVILLSLLLALMLFLWGTIFVVITRKKIDLFSSSICQTLDDMMAASISPQYGYEEEMIFVKINHRLKRLYDVMLEGRNQVAEERVKLQELISDISHQVKTPIANLKIVNDLLLEQNLPEDKRHELLHATSVQLDKLDFLMQSMIKTSRLETGVFAPVKTNCTIHGTLATALGSVLLNAEKKRIKITVDCPEDLSVPHDIKWTGEALFNILDNAVKYTTEGGSINVVVAEWEFYTKIDITDNGKGISESHQAEIWGRFYREEEVHDIEGIGIGLYLAREIITLQGGYIKVTSEIGKGSTFSIFLPNRA